jgi:hypothetical protein
MAPVSRLAVSGSSLIVAQGVNLKRSWSSRDTIVRRAGARRSALKRAYRDDRLSGQGRTHVHPSRVKRRAALRLEWRANSRGNSTRQQLENLRAVTIACGCA